jgi:Kelch motif
VSITRRRSVGLSLVLAALAVPVVLAVVRGSSGRPRPAAGTRSGPVRRGVARGGGDLTVRSIGALGAPVQDTAAAPVGGEGAVLAGGLTAADVSRPDVLLLRGRRTVGHGRLPAPLHDAAAAALGRSVYLLGGGDVSQSDEILGIDASSGRVSQAGRLPQKLSDVAAASLGGTIYVVGGYTGRQAVDTILAWRPGRAARTVARLPYPVRYAAVGAVRRELVIVGGSTPAGASRAVLSFDPARRRVRRVGRLTRPLTHAAAAPLFGALYVFGGRGDLPGTPTSRIWRIELPQGRVRPAGRLPQRLSDLAAVPLRDRILLAGGRTAEHAVSTISEAAPRP